MENSLKIYSKIKDIASGVNENEPMTRADLSYELKSLGIEADSVETGRLVYEAYLHYNDNSIRNAFLDNDRKRPVVDTYAVCHSAEKGDYRSVNIVSEAHLKQGGNAISSLKENLDTIAGLSSSRGTLNFMSVLSGTQGAENVQAAAADAYGKYSELVSAYDNAVGCVKTSMTDFVFLREYAEGIFKKYSMALVDIFGDSVKVVAPEIFDFNSVEYLDVKGMLDAVTLEYDTLANSCSLLIGDISEGFSSAVKSSAAIYRETGNRKAGLALAVLNMVGHYLDSSTRTAALKQEFVLFADKIKKDAFTIKGDLGRLTVIYRILSELYIPKAELFCSHVSGVMSSEFEHLVETVYSTEKLKELKQRRDAVLADYHDLKKKMTDDRINMDVYRAGIDSSRRLLEGSRDNYDEAISLRPSKPFFLLNLLTLGASGRRYNRDLSEWYDKYSYAVKFYENRLIDMKMDQEELNRLEAGYSADMATLRKYEAELSAVAREIKPLLNVSGDIKAKVLTHLESVLKLLKAAKDIASSGLDERYMKAVSFAEYKSPELPEKMKSALSDFTDTIRREIHENSMVSGQVRSEMSLSDEESNILDGRSKETADKLLNLFDECVRLRTLQSASAVSDREYSKKLEELQARFRKDMDDISAQGDVLREILRKANTASDATALKDALFLLSGNDGDIMSAEDFERFLNGEMDINL